MPSPEGTNLRPEAVTPQPLTTNKPRLQTPKPVQAAAEPPPADPTPSASAPALLPATAAAHPAPRPDAPEGLSPTNAIGVTEIKDYALHEPLLKGLSSWYGPGFHGRATANGETYNQHALTAAHPTLPMGTLVEVVNTENQKKVWVRINDRGPYKKGRILDLSRVAAKQLDMIAKGTAPVEIRIVRWPKEALSEDSLKPYTQYVVQVAAYDDQNKAESLHKAMANRFPTLSFLVDPRPQGFLAVAAGPFDTQGGAAQAAAHMETSGVKGMIRRLRK
ncbi:MAG: septal ring lytic transglycosylase RlpA family protein [Deltaproteobacteria bacterium]|nr:septal ring lytic transglycosylase RlpA family protein [Deltaproteobacteria bacterium]